MENAIGHVVMRFKSRVRVRKIHATADATDLYHATICEEIMVLDERTGVLLFCAVLLNFPLLKFYCCEAVFV